MYSYISIIGKNFNMAVLQNSHSDPSQQYEADDTQQFILSRRMLFTFFSFSPPSKILVDPPLALIVKLYNSIDNLILWLVIASFLVSLVVFDGARSRFVIGGISAKKIEQKCSRGLLYRSQLFVIEGSDQLFGSTRCDFG